MNFQKMVAQSVCMTGRLSIVFVVAIVMEFRYGLAGLVFCVTAENACEMLAKNSPAC
jgi:hypothetical protein